MIKRYFYIFSASLFILFSSTTGVKANIEDYQLEALSRQTNSPPSGFNYQAVLRDNNGDAIVSSDVDMRFTLSNSNGDVWIETHLATTNASGMITLVIGSGTQSGGSAASFSTIDWSEEISIKVEADSGAGFVDLGTSELQSVPYANYAQNGLTNEQAAEITANTSKTGITTEQATEITANTAKAGLTTEQVTAISNISGTNTGDQDISGITNNATAITLNTAKTGITTAQAAEITANTAKAGLTTEQVTAISNISGTNTGDQDISGISSNATDISTNVTAIALNTAKTGISTAQAAEITANTAKAGLTTEQVTAISNISGTNTGDQDISGIANNATAIGLNTAKTGITTAQAAEITVNTAKAGGAFSTATNLISAGDADDDFVFGSAQLSDAGNPAQDKRMFFDKSNGAFRAGESTGTEWDTPGNYSFAAGSNNTASGNNSTIGGGSGNAVSGYNSTISGGSSNTVSSKYSTIGGGTQNYTSSDYSIIGGGYGNTASGYISTVGGGRDNTASGDYSTTGGGRYNTASNYYSTAGGGYNNTASASGSTVGGGAQNSASASGATISGGYENNATKAYSTVGGGYNNNAIAKYSTVGGGSNVNAQAFGEFAVGLFSENAITPTAASFVATDRIFTVGNGASFGAKSNAMVILKNGNTDINGALVANSLGVDGQFTLPSTDGTAGQILSTDGSGAVTWATAGGGSFSGNGADSFVAGHASNSADAIHSTVSGGIINAASGASSTVGGGDGNTASGYYATIGGGQDNTATGFRSTIGGGRDNSTSAAYSAVAGGRGILSQAFGEFAVGLFSENATTPTALSFVATDRIFTVGNGTANGARSNAFTILKNGNTAISGTLAVGASSAEASAALEVSSTSQGFLPPRLTLAQRDAITSPVAGLLIWCTDCPVPEIQVYNGTIWTNMIGGTASGEI